MHWKIIEDEPNMSQDMFTDKNTISSLKLLLNVVNSFGNEYFVKINPDKSNLLVFGKSYNSDITIVFNDSIIPLSLQTDHLGHAVGP